MKSLALGLGLDQDFFVLCHQEILGPKSISKLRSIYYPALSKIDLVSGHVRCGEHSDYGTITFLYQVWTIISAVHSLEKNRGLCLMECPTKMLILFFCLMNDALWSMASVEIGQGFHSKGKILKNPL